jgi:hypothetical protein
VPAQFVDPKPARREIQRCEYGPVLWRRCKASVVLCLKIVSRAAVARGSETSGLSRPLVNIHQWSGAVGSEAIFGSQRGMIGG